jgi:2-oxoglutarate ferredoxin oxidoreductase subunit gamma
MVSYGAEMRGGTANSTVVISDGEIASPFVERPDIAIIMNRPSLDKFEDLILSGGLAVLNTSLVDRNVQRQDLDVAKIEASAIAHRLGNVRVANIVALGAFAAKTNLLEMSSLSRGIEDMFSSKKAALIDINKEALRQGAQMMAGK